MCLIAIALGCHARYPLVLAGNRDEFHRRPAVAAHRWSDAPAVFAGRDLDKGGTWLGVSARGALAVITNYRDPSRPRAPSAPSRGALVADFLATEAPSAAGYLGQHARPDGPHEGFNLIAADRTGIWYASNRGAAPRRLGSGVHGLSNHLLGTPWPKVRRLTGAVAGALGEASGGDPAEALFRALRDQTQVADHELPETGVGPEWERRLAPAFIVSPDYGTRCSTVLLVSVDGAVEFEERTFAPDGHLAGRVRARLPLASEAATGLLGAALTSPAAP